MLNQALNIKEWYKEWYEKNWIEKLIIVLKYWSMIMMKPVMNALILMTMMVLIFNMFFVIKVALEYMMLPNIVPLIWFIVAVPTPYFATMLTAPLLD